MNKIEKLLATKAELEAELEKEHQIKIAKEEEERRVKVREEALIRQHSEDMNIYNTVETDFYNKIKERWDIKTLDDAVFLIATLLYRCRDRIDIREFMFSLDSINRIKKERGEVGVTFFL